MMRPTLQPRRLMGAGRCRPRRQQVRKVPPITAKGQLRPCRRDQPQSDRAGRDRTKPLGAARLERAHQARLHAQGRCSTSVTTGVPPARGPAGRAAPHPRRAFDRAVPPATPRPTGPRSAGSQSDAAAGARNRAALRLIQRPAPGAPGISRSWGRWARWSTMQRRRRATSSRPGSHVEAAAAGSLPAPRAGARIRRMARPSTRCLAR